MGTRTSIQASEKHPSHTTGRIYGSNPVPAINQLAIREETIYGMTLLRIRLVGRGDGLGGPDDVTLNPG